MAQSEKAPARPQRPLKKEPLERLAQSYWRLWRRNWRPPFPEDDAPRGAEPAADGGRRPKRGGDD